MTAPYGAYGDAPVAASAPPQTARARAALIAAVLVVALSLAGNAFGYFLPFIVNTFDMPASGYWLLFLPFQVSEGLLAIAALVLGIGPLAGPGPRGIAGIAVGVATASLVAILFGYLIGWLLPLVL